MLIIVSYNAVSELRVSSAIMHFPKQSKGILVEYRKKVTFMQLHKLLFFTSLSLKSILQAKNVLF